MEQPSLFMESLNDAVRDTCRAIGVKQMAVELFPTKKPDEAARYLLDCLNPERAQKLDGDQILLIARRGHSIGCHLIVGYICQDAGYMLPTPVEPKDELAALQREFIESVRAQKQLLTRIERVGR